jgi:hypothetical protein
MAVSSCERSDLMLNVVVTMEKDWKREEREGLCEVFPSARDSYPRGRNCNPLVAASTLPRRRCYQPDGAQGPRPILARLRAQEHRRRGGKARPCQFTR